MSLGAGTGSVEVGFGAWVGSGGALDSLGVGGPTGGSVATGGIELDAGGGGEGMFGAVSVGPAFVGAVFGEAVGLVGCGAFGTDTLGSVSFSDGAVSPELQANASRARGSNDPRFRSLRMPII